MEIEVAAGRSEGQRDLAPLLIGPGPDERQSVGSGSAFDASIFLFDAACKVHSHADLIFYIRTKLSCQVVNDATGNGAVRYDSQNDCSTETAMVVEKLDLHNLDRHNLDRYKGRVELPCRRPGLQQADLR